ncbi:hypothetical protein JCM15765_24980 [Paradesulfitobacterium aromaticivorans]
MMLHGKGSGLKGLMFKKSGSKRLGFETSRSKTETIIRLTGFILLGSLLIGLSGCASNSTSSNSSAQTGSATAGSTPAAAANSGTVSGSSIDPEQPERVAEVYGKVKSIQGNVVLIAEMQRQQTGAQLSVEEKAKRQEQMQSLSEEERRNLQASQEVMTGRNITITVPVGIPVKVKASGASGGTVEDGTIASIKAGSIVNMWTETGDSATAEYVSISTR